MVQVQMTAPMISVQAAVTIPALSHQEAMTLSREEYKRFLDLISALAENDWQQQTACSLWTVKDIVAHQAAHVSSFTSLGSFLAQLNPLSLFPYLTKGMSPLDAWNQAEVEKRQGNSPQELIAEIRDASPASLQGKDKIPAWVHSLVLPLPGLDQARSMAYLFDLVYTRDMWMHRVDICMATGRKMPLDSTHDARTIALIVLDLAVKAQKELKGRSAVLDITGAAGGRYRIGQSASPEATIEIDPLDFAVLTSGREKAATLLSNSRAIIAGDIDFGRSVLNFCENRVLY